MLICTTSFFGDQPMHKLFILEIPRWYPLLGASMNITILVYEQQHLPEKGKPKCCMYTRSTTVQNAFQPIPGSIQGNQFVSVVTEKGNDSYNCKHALVSDSTIALNKKNFLQACRSYQKQPGLLVCCSDVFF